MEPLGDGSLGGVADGTEEIFLLEDDLGGSGDRSLEWSREACSWFPPERGIGDRE